MNKPSENTVELQLSNRFALLVDEMDNKQEDGGSNNGSGNGSHNTSETWNTRSDPQQSRPTAVARQSLDARMDEPSGPAAAQVADSQTSAPQVTGKPHIPQVNVSSLKPANLMCLSLRVLSSDVNVLVDSGAGKSLCRVQVLINNGINFCDQEPSVIKGLGKTHTYALGNASLPLNFFGVIISVPVIVVANDVIQYDVILGYSFLHAEKVSINMSKRTLSKTMKDNSTVKVFLSENNSVISVMLEDMPVYASKKMRVNESGTRVPIVANFCSVVKGRIPSYFFEGKEGAGKHSLDGIISLGQDTPEVIVSSVKGEKLVSEGCYVGRVSTLLELDEEEFLNEVWTISRLKDEVELGVSLVEEQKEAVYKMLLEAKSVMSRSDDDIGRANVSPHVIELTDNTPIWLRPRRFSEPVNKEIDRQCEELLSSDIIEYSDSDWSAAVVPVRKSSGELRMCLDYRQLNKVTKPEKFPMPNITDSIYAGHNVQYFTKLDLVRGYYQVPIHEHSRKYTAFSTPHNHYQFKRLSFGLRNSAIAFQKTMQQILSEFCFHNVLVYIDDILIMTETYDEHLVLVKKVLTTLGNNGIKIKVQKCEFFRGSVNFLGHIIGAEGIRKSPEFMNKIVNYPKPTTVTQLRQFLGLVNFQRKFIDRCSVIARPLTELTGRPKKEVLSWTPEMNVAFESLKDALLKDVALSFPDYSDSAERLELYVDASSVGAGACLMQKQKGEYRTIAYSSRTFTDTQRRYSTIERELTAIRWGIQTFRSFLFAVPFILFTDHKPLIFLHNMARENSRIMRTLNELAEFDFIIRYRPGRDNEAADTMSRIVGPMPEDQQGLEANELPSGLKHIGKVDGGGNSLFESLRLCLEDADELDVVIPDSALDLRVMLIDFLMQNPAKFNMDPKGNFRKRMRIMRQNEQLPCEEVILVACAVFNVEIHVHHGAAWPVIYRADHTGACLTILHLQCISGIHFNPLYDRKQRLSGQAVNEEYVNYCCDNEIRIQESREDKEATDKKGKCENKQSGNLHIPSSCFVEAHGVKFCALIDTGAQVSLIGEDTVKLLVQREPHLQVRDFSGNLLSGISGGKSEVVGYVELKLSIAEQDFDIPVPFAIVKTCELPCCAILGANYLIANEISVEFWNFAISGPSCKIDLSCNREHSGVTCLNNANHWAIFSFTGIITAEQTDSEELVESSDCDSNEPVEVPKLCSISNAKMRAIQSGDVTISALKQYIVERSPARNCTVRSLQPFKKYWKKFRVVSDLCLFDKDGQDVVVVPFEFLVDVVYKTHVQMAHIGKHKLENLIMNKFFHPALKKVIKDITRSCKHCQLYKVSSQLISPPTLKIVARYPFDLVAVDIMMFPKSSSGHMAILVCVDHFSKFLFAVPLMDKKSSSVCKALNNFVFPCMPRLPSRILSDNGPEFRSSEFKNAVSAYNISHVFSTRYRAQGNGAVERSNRTIIEFVKGVVQGNPKSWDVMLPRAVIVYNSTWHASIKMTPSDCILGKAHSCDSTIPIEASGVESWKEAHRDFQSFEINQKVALKIQKIGNQLQYKLGNKFDGPYKVTKVQSNGISYEISDGVKVIKAHHKQLKKWFDPPNYLLEYVRREDSVHPVPHVDSSDSSSSSSSDDECIIPTDIVMSSDSDLDGGNLDNECTSPSHVSDAEANPPNFYLFDKDFIDEFYNLRDRYFTFVNKCEFAREVEEAVNEAEKNVLDWSFGSDAMDYLSPENIEPRYSTRELEDEDTSMPENVERLSPIVADDANNESDSSLSSFLLWLEQSMLAQEEQLDRVANVSRILNDAWLEGVTDSVSLGDTTERDDQTDILMQMCRHVNHVRESVANYRQNRGSLWMTRFEINGSGDGVIEEVSDRIEELPETDTDVCRRVTRSQGPVKEYPNVQSATLEYKAFGKS